MRSPRFAPAGLLVEHAGWRVMLDGGPGASPRGAVDAWLVTDARAELFREIRALAGRHGLEPRVGDFLRPRTLCIRPEPVTHTSHPTFGYRIDLAGRKVAWAPEFFEFPEWASGADLLFADGAGWDRPIRFARGVGGHACVIDVAREAQRHRVRRLVFAHIGRPSIRAMDAGRQPPFGELGHDGEVFQLGREPRFRRTAILIDVLACQRVAPELGALVEFSFPTSQVLRNLHLDPDVEVATARPAELGKAPSGNPQDEPRLRGRRDGQRSTKNAYSGLTRAAVPTCPDRSFPEPPDR